MTTLNTTEQNLDQNTAALAGGLEDEGTGTCAENDDAPATPGPMGALAWMANEASIAAKATELAGIKSKTKTSRKRVVKQTESTLDKIKAFIETGVEFTLQSLAEKFEIKESTGGVFVSTLKSKNGAHAMPITIDKKTKTYKYAAPADETEGTGSVVTQETAEDDSAE